MTFIPKISDKLPIMEIFYSIQGEGYYSGAPAIFLRLGGCDVGCHWCDVKESWDENDHPFLSVDEIINRLKEFTGRLVVVTGGEPMMYDLSVLTARLKSEGYQLNIETSGAYPMTGQWDWVCFSPKKFKAPHSSIYEQAHELKAIVFNKSDFAFAEEHRVKLTEACRLYLQPEWSRAGKMSESIIEYTKENPDWNISLQTHKYLNIP